MKNNKQLLKYHRNLLKTKMNIYLCIYKNVIIEYNLKEPRKLNFLFKNL